MADLRRKSMQDILRQEQREEVQYVLGNPPSWIIRRGISFIAVAVVVCLAIGWWVEYPDKVEGAVRLYRAHPPVSVMAAPGSQLDQLLVTDGMEVDSGMVLATFDRQARLADVERVEDWLQEAILTDYSVDWLQLQIPRVEQLGALHADCRQLHRSIKDFQSWLQDHQAGRQLALLDQHTGSLRHNQQSLQTEKKAQEEILALAAIEKDRQEQLFESGTISAKDWEEARQVYLEHFRQSQRVQLDLEQVSQQLSEQALVRLQVEGQVADRYRQYEKEVREQAITMLQAIRSWKAENLLIAPVAGRVSMPRVWNTAAFFEAAEELLAIIPPNGQDPIVGLVELPVRGSGKVLPGMEVRIQLDNYPAQEYGDVVGTIESVSARPIDNTEEDAYVLARVILPNRLLTSYQKEVLFLQEMCGHANVILESRSVLERIFDKVLGAVARV
jgi:multidrug resistance efflux pump